MKRPFESRLFRLAALAAALAGVCLAQVPGPGERPANVAAKAMSIQGRVSVMRGSLPWALSVGDTVNPKEVIVTGPDGAAEFQVNDGSTFTVYPNSRVAFRNDFSITNLIDVILGTIKVHIQRWGGLPNNTSISTPTAVISVRGTTFDVKVEEDDTTEVTVQEGEVAVRHVMFFNERPRVLRDGDTLRVTKNAPLARARVDRGAIFGRLARAALDALDTALWQQRGGGGAGGGPRIPGSRGPVGDTAGGGQDGGSAPPPGTPPPPPPQ